MTLVQESHGIRIFENPGTDDDGFISPEWAVAVSDILWEGGAGDWLYVGYKSTGADDPEAVYAFRMGSESVKRHAQQMGV